MATRDYYEILGVERTIDAAGLKSAYHKLAMLHHPDRNGGCEDAMARFKEISAAYSILSDNQKRAAYDRFGHAGVDGGGGGFGGQGQGFTDVNDIFSQVFGDAFGDVFGGRAGGGARQHGPRRGSDLRYDMEITLEQAYKGSDVEIAIPTTAACETCEGSGARKGAKATTCSTCQGAGRVRSANGFFQVERTCPHCGGQGSRLSAADTCTGCAGHGQVRKNRKLQLKIPAGVDDGSRIRLSGEGDAGTRGEPDEFAGAGGRGEPRIAGLRREQREAGRGGHFDDRDARIFDFRISIFDLEEGAGGGWDEGERNETQSGDDGFAARAGDGVGFKRATEGLSEDLAKTLASIGERARVDGPIGPMGAEAAGGEGAGLGGGEGVFEFVESEQGAHGG
jgi:hypothetical protein